MGRFPVRDNFERAMSPGEKWTSPRSESAQALS